MELKDAEHRSGYFYSVQGWPRLLLVAILVCVSTTWVGLARRSLPPVASPTMEELALGAQDRWHRPDGLPLVETSGRAPVESVLAVEGPRSWAPGSGVRVGLGSPRGSGVLRVEVPLGTRLRPDLGSACWACSGSEAGSVCRCELGHADGGASLGLEVLRRGAHGLPLPASIRLCAEKEGEGLWTCRQFGVGPSAVTARKGEP